MRYSGINGVGTFLMAAESLSFSATARELGITPQSVAYAIDMFEESVGLTLFERTTKGLILTGAGQVFARDASRGATIIQSAIERLGADPSSPAGSLRLRIDRSAESFAVEKLPRFVEKFPLIELDIFVTDLRLSFAEDGFDAEVRQGELRLRDVLSVRISDPQAMTVVGSPEYLSGSVPALPTDLIDHRCITIRDTRSSILKGWSFVDDGANFDVEVDNYLITNDYRVAIQLAIAGCGLAFVPKALVEENLADGSLQNVLESFCPSRPPFYINVRESNRLNSGLRSFIDFFSM
jgi:DNA-binding transcriptional LysR family regulator